MPTSPAPPLGELIKTLTVDDLKENVPSSDLTISKCTTVASFSWLDGKVSEPTILVPGKPPLWTPQPTLPTLREDSGTYFRDKNAARYPKHPLEPAVIAALDADEDTRAGVAIVACGSTLGNLLRFIRGEDKQFRMLVHKVKNTVFLTRRENSPTELIPGVRGYGHTFPEANTTWESDVKGSASHQRVVRYHFGGLELLVRFEADGYIKPPSSPTSGRSPESKKLNDDNDDDGDSLDDLLGRLTLPSSSPIISSGTLHVKKAGTSLVPHSQLFELKTRSVLSKETKDHLAEELPRLWVSQIPAFILAFHTRGLFKKEDLSIRDVREDVKKWEKDHAEELSKLAVLLRWLVHHSAEENFELCFAGDGKLEVREMLEDAGEALSEDVKKRWASGQTTDLAAASEEEDDDDDRFESLRDGYSYDSDDDDWGKESEPDYTACSAEDCGYCGKCQY